MNDPIFYDIKENRLFCFSKNYIVYEHKATKLDEIAQRILQRFYMNCDDYLFVGYL